MMRKYMIGRWCSFVGATYMLGVFKMISPEIPPPLKPAMLGVVPALCVSTVLDWYCSVSARRGAIGNAENPEPAKVRQ